MTAVVRPVARLISRPCVASSSRLPLSSLAITQSALLPLHRPSRSYSSPAKRPATTLATASAALSDALPASLLSSAAQTSSAGPTTPLVVQPPSLEAIKAEGYLDDAELVPPDDAYLNITDPALQQLIRITKREPKHVLDKGLALRVGVESGGCHGYQYTMALTEERGVDDYIMQPKDVNCIPVVVDLTSLGLLKGATLHHATELIGSSFRIQDNPQAKESGSCGCGISWEAK